MYILELDYFSGGQWSVVVEDISYISCVGGVPVERLTKGH
jgi:hypothetical protein